MSHPPQRLRRFPLEGTTLMDRPSRIHGVRLMATASEPTI